MKIVLLAIGIIIVMFGLIYFFVGASSQSLFSVPIDFFVGRSEHKKSDATSGRIITQPMEGESGEFTPTGE